MARLISSGLTRAGLSLWLTAARAQGLGGPERHLRSPGLWGEDWICARAGYGGGLNTLTLTVILARRLHFTLTLPQ